MITVTHSITTRSMPLTLAMLRTKDCLGLSLHHSDYASAMHYHDRGTPISKDHCLCHMTPLIPVTATDPHIPSEHGPSPPSDHDPTLPHYHKHPTMTKTASMHLAQACHCCPSPSLPQAPNHHHLHSALVHPPYTTSAHDHPDTPVNSSCLVHLLQDQAMSLSSPCSHYHKH